MSATCTRIFMATGLSLVLTTAFAATAAAQEVLPKPEVPFKGTIGNTYKELEARFPDVAPGTGRRAERADRHSG